MTRWGRRIADPSRLSTKEWVPFLWAVRAQQWMSGMFLDNMRGAYPFRSPNGSGYVKSHFPETPCFQDPQALTTNIGSQLVASWRW